MKTPSPKNEAKDYEIPCQILAFTEVDMSQALSEGVNVPVGGLVRDELPHEETVLDFSQAEHKKSLTDRK